jgi:hypothetical protein
MSGRVARGRTAGEAHNAVAPAALLTKSMVTLRALISPTGLLRRLCTDVTPTWSRNRQGGGPWRRGPAATAVGFGPRGHQLRPCAQGCQRGAVRRHRPVAAAAGGVAIAVHRLPALVLQPRVLDGRAGARARGSRCQLSREAMNRGGDGCVLLLPLCSALCGLAQVHIAQAARLGPVDSSQRPSSHC